MNEVTVTLISRDVFKAKFSCAELKQNGGDFDLYVPAGEELDRLRKFKENLGGLPYLLIM